MLLSLASQSFLDIVCLQYIASHLIRMKIEFSRQDSFYKITKTIEKIPNQRKVVFVIDENNNMFANDWR